MNRLRTHIARVITVVLIWTGFSLYMVQPVQAEHSSYAFTRWLSNMVKSASDAEVQDELKDLRYSEAQLDQIIEKASQIVQNNNEQFEFDFTRSTATQHFYQLLLIEWNQFQTGNAMASVPVQHHAKVAVHVNLDNTVVFGSVAVNESGLKQTQVAGGQPLLSQQLFSVTVEPMEDSIAIGAP